jgi:hypothetical protein
MSARPAEIRKRSVDTIIASAKKAGCPRIDFSLGPNAVVTVHLVEVCAETSPPVEVNEWLTAEPATATEAASDPH